MRRTTISLVAASALAMWGCGSTPQFANEPRPPTPVNVTVYINDSRVSVSPSSVGAGPVTLIVTNAASTAQSLTIPASGEVTCPESPGPQPLASTQAPINPQATAELTINFTAHPSGSNPAGPGDYSVLAGCTASGSTDATLGTPSSIRPGTLHITTPGRSSASNQLLQP